MDNTAPTEFALYAFTPQGVDLALRLQAPFGAQLYLPDSLRLETPGLPSGTIGYDKLSLLMPETFSRHSCHIFIGAAGIAVRAVAPHIKGKETDPAVLVLDQAGRYVVSLLSGHLGGANAAAYRVAAVTGATPVITTATDIAGLPAIDLLAKEQGLAIGSLDAAKQVSAALLAGERVLLYDPGNLLKIRGSGHEALFTRIASFSLMQPQAEPAAPSGTPPRQTPPTVIVTERIPPASEPMPERCLLLHPPVLCAGVGCRRGAPSSDIVDAVQTCFARHGLALPALLHLASIDAKTDEPGLAEAAARLGVPLRFYNARELSAFPVTSPSPKAREQFGVDGVCEPAALAAAGSRMSEGVLVAPKTVLNGVTVAVAMRETFLPANKLS